jgi:hypothetical protein
MVSQSGHAANAGCSESEIKEFETCFADVTSKISLPDLLDPAAYCNASKAVVECIPGCHCGSEDAKKVVEEYTSSFKTAFPDTTVTCEYGCSNVAMLRVPITVILVAVAASLQLSW